MSGTVYWSLSHITFQDCRMHSFSLFKTDSHKNITPCLQQRGQNHSLSSGTPPYRPYNEVHPTNPPPPHKKRGYDQIFMTLISTLVTWKLTSISLMYPHPCIYLWLHCWSIYSCFGNLQSTMCSSLGHFCMDYGYSGRGGRVGVITVIQMIHKQPNTYLFSTCKTAI